MTQPGPSAARRYKDITGGMTEAVARMRREDAERSRRLAESLVELHEAMAEAADREALTVLGVALQWESALESLWYEQWMTLRPLPSPDPSASPRDLDYLDAVVAQRYEALREAVRRRGLLGRR
jgi:DNA-binding FadR family transcriptional regulator